MNDYEGALAIERAWREGLTPDPQLTVSEWSDEHRVLSSKSSAEPGRWRTSRTPYLRDIMDCLSPTSPIERVVFMKGAQVGAPLALDTPIPTPTGWTPMGELRPGDYVFAEDGWPCRVTGVSPVLTGRECYEIEFEDGEKVVCDADHRWSVLEATHDGPVPKVLRTVEMVGREQWSNGKRWRFTIPHCAPVELPDCELPIDPYLLGLWLGDGSARQLPPAYLRASRTQRQALLQGLMDSTGTIAGDGKSCEFSNADWQLIEGVLELLRSLGYRPHLYSTVSRREQVQGGERVGLTCRRVRWTAYLDRPGQPWRRAIVAVRPVASVPVRCIEVDSPNHLFLCGKGWVPTHNTETGSNWIGYVIHHAPGPMMAVWPTVEMAKRSSKQRIDPLIEESPALAERVAPARSRDSGNTILAKEFRGGILILTGANSAVGLRSMPVRYLFLDEVDGFPMDVDGEGSAIALAEARTRTFARRKIFIVSTPTIAGASAIELEYLASDQRRYFVPCPLCGHFQWLQFPQLVWERGLPETVRYRFLQCDRPFAEHHKAEFLAAGEWRATAVDTAVSRTTAGFHLSSLYSPLGWRSWREIAAAWDAANGRETGSSAAIKTFKNTELGETWVEEGEAPDWQRLLERREDYPIGTIPLGGLLLVAGADIQKDRIEVSVWAYGRGKEAWLVEHRILTGDTSREPVWRRLEELRQETWTHATGVQVPLARLAVDTGYATQEAYAFVRKAQDPRVMAVKGVARGAALIGSPTAVEVNVNGKKLRRGIKLYAVAGGIAKLELYNNLKKTPEIAADGVTPVFPAGYVHLPMIDSEYLQQLCGEQLVTRYDRNRFAHREWQKVRERNDALDAFIYGRAAAAAAGLDRFEERHWRELERQLGIAVPAPTPPPLTNSNLTTANEATQRGGLAVSGTRSSGRRVIKSRWLA